MVLHRVARFALWPLSTVMITVIPAPGVWAAGRRVWSELANKRRQLLLVELTRCEIWIHSLPTSKSICICFVCYHLYVYLNAPNGGVNKFKISSRSHPKIGNLSLRRRVHCVPLGHYVRRPNRAQPKELFEATVLYRAHFRCLFTLGLTLLEFCFVIAATANSNGIMSYDLNKISDALPSDSAKYWWQSQGHTVAWCCHGSPLSAMY